MKLNTRTVALFLLSLVNVASAQQAIASDSATEEPEKWYQIELLIYSTTNNDLSGSELWPLNPDLRYPNQIQQLHSSLETKVNEDMDSIDKTAEVVSNTETESNFSPIVQTEFNTKTLEEQPFYLLDSNEYQFGKAVKKLTKKTNVNILFHESWRQPLTNRKQATPVLIQGGGQFDQHFELEGTIKFSVERYIHIDTDLWLSSFANKLAVEDNPWGALPIPPVSIDAGHALNPLPPAELDHQYQSPFQYMFADNYSVLATVVMRQHRRMRSKELHYIDHPLMGVLVKVIPYERVIPEEIAEEDPTETITTPQSEQVDSQ